MWNHPPSEGPPSRLTETNESDPYPWLANIMPDEGSEGLICAAEMPVALANWLMAAMTFWTEVPERISITCTPRGPAISSVVDERKTPLDAER